MTAEAMSGAGGSDAALEMVRRMIAEAPVLMALFDGDRRCIAVSGGWLGSSGRRRVDGSASGPRR